MSGSVVRLPGRGNAVDPELRRRLRNIAAVITAIQAGELLSALPECAVARDHHKTGITLLALAESEILSICAELDG
ncbi:hypothetical protein [Phenylobacterium sp.]|uniref:hypothetical protein n=1 Tax=Phenylobacterium sp. TaxID=1871053 RepID=UPI003BAD0421